MKLQETTIPEYYKGKTILVTGASGFIGKVLIWKLLKSCSSLDTIYILVRPKYGKNVQCRVSELFQAPIFDNFKQENPQLLSKVKAIAGDIAEDRLALSVEDERTLADSVQIVFHIAAVVKFDAVLKDAVNLNVNGTLRLLDLATKMSKLEAFIHVSTAYCHCDVVELEEKTYATHESPRQVMELVRWSKPEFLDSISENLIKPHPNTYTYSKRLSENLVTEYFPKLPIAIARPSIVVPSFQEPFPGWVDNLNGFTGLMIASGKGVLRVAWVGKKPTADTIPVDVVCNGLIAAAWRTGGQIERPKTVPVYNLVATEFKKLTFGQIFEDAKQFREVYPFSIMLWYPDTFYISNIYLFTIFALFLHWVPAFFVDTILYLLGYKTFMIRTQEKLHNGLKVVHYFTMREWIFATDNILKLRDTMSEEDKNTFKLTNAGVNIRKFLENAVVFCRSYLVKDDPSTLPLARRRLKRFYWLHLLMRVTFWLIVAYIIVQLVNYVFGTSFRTQRTYEELI